MKAANIIKLICWLIILILLIAVLVWGLRSNSFAGMFGNFDGFKINSIPAGTGSQGAYEQGGSYSVPVSGVTDVCVDWINGKVTVEPYDGDAIVFTETANRTITNELALVYHVSGGKLTIAFSNGTINSIWRNVTKELTVKVPTTLASSLKELDVTTVSAPIYAAGFIASDIELESTSGEINASDLKAAELSLHSTSGAIQADSCVCDELDAQTVSGSFDYSGSATTVSLETVSGEVDMGFTKAPLELDMEGVSGAVTLRLPEDMAGFRIDVSRVSGEFSCAFPTVSENGYYVYGDGSAVYNVDTVSGGISINKN